MLSQLAPSVRITEVPAEVMKVLATLKMNGPGPLSVSVPDET